jgi:hypothetical protein
MMPILKRRLDICGREKTWEYVIEAAGRQFHVTASQRGREDPDFSCSCGGNSEVSSQEPMFFGDSHGHVCNHIAEAQQDLRIARQAAAQMIP